jgi:hypothetical protein
MPSNYKADKTACRGRLLREGRPSPSGEDRDQGEDLIEVDGEAQGRARSSPELSRDLEGPRQRRRRERGSRKPERSGPKGRKANR